MPLSKKDLDNIEQLFDLKFEEKLDEKLDEKLKFLPTKEEFFDQMSKVMGELKAVRDSQELHANSHKEINDEIDKLKKAVFSKN